jgi:hypothetical protein
LCIPIQPKPVVQTPKIYFGNNDDADILKHTDTSNLQVVFAGIKDTIIFNAMKDSGIPVERKNFAASTASSSRKGSNDTALEDEKGKGRGDEDKVGRKEEKGYNRGREKDKEGGVREEWIENRDENIWKRSVQNGDLGMNHVGKELDAELTPSEIGVAI